MRRCIGLVAGLAAMCAAMVACGGGREGASSADVCPRVDGTQVVQTLQSRRAIVTFADAQQIADFQIALPAQLPAGVELATVSVDRGGPCFGGTHPSVELSFRGPSYGFSLEESVVDTELDRSEPVLINGVEGKIARSNPQPDLTRVFVTWTQGGVSYVAISGLVGGLTEQQFLEILESVPE